MTTHAFLPTPILIEDNLVRVFVAFLDAESIGRVGWVDIDPREPNCVLRVSPRPALDVGPPGHFDDSGVTPVWTLWRGPDLYLFYNGWQRSNKVPYHIFTGVAVSRDRGISFERLSSVPLLDRTHEATLIRSTPCIIPPSKRSSKWRMWYSFGSTDLVRDSGRWAPSYAIGFLESNDLMNWPQRDEVAVPLAQGEFGLTRPAVEETSDGYHMLLSVRSETRNYHIEEAKSDNGRYWERCGTAIIDPTPGAWDSDMVAFTGVVDTSYGRFMFYNGNGYGRTGFGVSRWDPV
jgi:hypothetical protein